MSIFDSFPLMNAYSVNLDWILRTVKGNEVEIEKLKKDFSELVNNLGIPEAVNAKIEEMIADGTFQALFPQNEINIDSLGAVGDGVTDDTETLRLATAACNASGKTLTASPGKTYLVNGKDILLNCNVDFHGATILMGATEEWATLFKVGEPTESFVISDSLISKNRIADSRFFGKTFEIVTPISFGIRSSYETEHFHRMTFIADKQGFFTNSEFYGEIVAGSYTVNNLRDMGEQAITIRNVKIKYPNGGAYTRQFIYCYRNNVKIENILIDGNIGNANFSGSVMGFENCCNIRIDNVCGANPTETGSGYIFGLWGCSDFTITNCNLYNNANGSWGAIGIGTVTNFSAENVNSNRFDVHYEAFGYYNIRNCVTEECTLAGGNGSYIFENCVFLNRKELYGLVYLRYDLALVPSGIVKFVNCKYESFGKKFFINFSAPQYNTNCVKAGFEELQIVIDNIVTNNDIEGVVRLNISDLAAKTAVKICNSQLRQRVSATIIKNDGGDLSRVILYNCVSANTIRPASANVRSIIIDTCTFAIADFSTYVPSISLQVSGSTILALINYKISPPFLTMCNNVIGTDRALTFNGTRKRCSANVIAAATNENEDSWN